MSKNNELYSGILILHKDGLYLVNQKQFKSLENAKTYIDTFLNLSEIPKISDSVKIGDSLSINDVINSIELKNYFGNKSEKWIPELTKLVEKKKIGDFEINDVNFRNNGSWATFKFSWLGLIFGNYWAIYHKTLWWWQFLILCLILDVIFGFLLLYFLDSSLLLPVSSTLYVMYGKSLLLMGKAKELERTGKLMPASWKGVSIYIIIQIVIGLLFELL